MRDIHKRRIEDNFSRIINRMFDESASEAYTDGYEKGQRDTEARFLSILADIREVVGDPLGTMMQDELVSHIRDIVKEREQLHSMLDLQKRFDEQEKD